MNAAGALRELERQLIPVRSTAGVREATAVYSEVNLPAAMPERDRAKVEQGFAAGYDAAMNAVRHILANVQTMALRGEALPDDHVAHEEGDARTRW